MTLTNWLQILFGCAALVSMTVAVVNYLEQRRDRKRGSGPRPAIKATINKTYHRDGWRSVQLHVVPSDVQPNFPYDQWRILHARLIAPRRAALARAENDDYAAGVFFDDNPVREIAGRAQGNPQRFALNFFIRFEGEERGQQARFKVTFGPADETWRETRTLTVTVPIDAAAAPVSENVA